MANGLSFIGPPEAPVRGTTQTGSGDTPIDAGPSLVEELLSRLRVDAPEPPPKIGPGRRILGSIGDALTAAATVRAGGTPPQIGTFAATVLQRQEDFKRRSAEAAAANQALQRRIRLGQFEVERAHGFRLKENKAREKEQKPGDLFFRGDLQWLVDDAGNRWIEVALQDKTSGEIKTKIIAAPSTSRNNVQAPVGTLRIASQPVMPFLTPEGIKLLNRTSGEALTETPGVPVTPAEEADPLPPGPPQPKIIGTPISSEQNVEAIQAEHTLLTIAESVLATIDTLLKKNFVPGERTLKRVFLTTPGIADIGGREAVTTLDPDFSGFVSELKRLQSAFEEEQRGNRLTSVRLGELAGFIPRGDEAFGDARTKIRNLIDDVRRRMAIRADLQPGISSKLPEEQRFEVPDSEFTTLRNNRQSGKTMSNEDLERYLIGLKERTRR